MAEIVGEVGARLLLCRGCGSPPSDLAGAGAAYPFGVNAASWLGAGGSCAPLSAGSFTLAVRAGSPLLFTELVLTMVTPSM